MIVNRMARPTARAIQSEAEAALLAVAKKHNLTVKPDAGIIGIAGDVSFKFTFCQTSEGGTAIDAKFSALEQIKPGVAGKTFYVPKYGYVTLTGYNSRANRYPVEYKDKDGTPMKFTEALLALCTPEREAV